MRPIHRFYISPEKLELRHRLWVDDSALVRQWSEVLCYKVGDELVLFDGQRHERLYKIERFKRDSCQLQHVTDLQPKRPKCFVHLFWTLLKPNKNDWLLQKCSELGVSAFTPITTSRTLSRTFDDERARRIIIEATEQCGRLDIPRLHDPIDFQGALKVHKDNLKLYFVHIDAKKAARQPVKNKPAGIYIGPEGGWEPAELDVFRQHKVLPMNLGDFTLRAETAAVVAVSQFLQK